MPTSTGGAQYTTGYLDRVIQLAVSASGDTQSIAIPHGISFADATATSTIAGLLKVNMTPNGAGAASLPLWYVSAMDSVSVTLATMASGASALGGAANYAVNFQRTHSIQR